MYACKRYVVIVVMIMMLMDSTSGQSQYPNCVSCSDGLIPLSPLSYNTMRSNVFNGTLPSNEGCTNGISIDGQVTIDCEQGTTLIDCDRGLTPQNIDYSDLSNTFAWNRTTSVAQQVSIVFRFDQQINISRIIMFFWNSQSNSVIIPNVRMYWSNNDSITPSNEITITTSSPSRTGDARRRMIIDINDGPQFQYLRIEMSFYDDSEWIFLGEVFFCGNAAPYRITEPSTNNDVQIVSPNATMTSITCSLNVTIPSTVIVTWSHNTSLITDRSQITTAGSTTTLLIGDLQSSDAGVYQCVFNDTAGSGRALRRNIRLIIIVPQIVFPPEDFHLTFTNLTSSVQLMCSLNVVIPSSVTVVWSYNQNPFLTIEPPNKVITAGNTTTLVIGDPQPSDAGRYDCAFEGLRLGRIIILEFANTTPTATTATTATTTTSVSSSITVTSTTTTTTTTTAITTTATTTTATTTTATTTTATTTTATTTNATTTTATTADDTDSSTNIGVIVAPIIVIIVAVIIVIIVVIIFCKWRKRKMYATYDKTTNLHEETAYYSTVKDSTDEGKPDNGNNQQPLELYAVPDKQKKEKSTEPLVPQEQQTLSMITTDYEDVELDIYAAPDIPERTEASIVFDNVDDENPIYSEAINPSVIIDSSRSHDFSSDNDSLCPYASIYADPLPLTKSEGPPIVSNKNIESLNQLGTGQFGEVMLANTVGLSNQYLGIGKSDDSTITMKVAVKMLKPSPSEEVRKAFEKEIKFMSRLKDDNVIKLLGICTTGTPFIMMQYMENGDLNNYLRKLEFTYETEKLPAENEITLNALVYMSFQIASGMKYLSSCKFIHRDLAARNILVGVDYTVKIADFGMSQNLYSAYYYKVGGRIFLPIRWMAYECFFGKFSVKTDVWAFGITLWEIFTLCKRQPFTDLADQELIEDAIRGAKRKIPDQPDVCPNDIYEIMKSCFHHEPSERAGFNVLCDQLNECYSNIL